MQIKLSHQLVLSYVGIMAIAALIGGLMTILLEQPHVDSTVDIMAEAMTETELESLAVRMDVLLATAISLFVQFVGDVNYQFVYATDVFDGTTAVSSFYPSYDVLEHATNPPPNVDSDGKSIEYSSWYKHTNRTALPYLNLSSVLDNPHGAILKSNPSFAAGVYMGFEDGMWRPYPYQNVGADYQTIEYICAHNNQQVVGFDPRCREWYHAAKLNQSEVIFTAPYIDASSGDVTISLARAVVVSDAMVGAVGADITLASLEETVLSATVMENGYTYMCDDQKHLIVHPDLNFLEDDNLYQVTAKEFNPIAEDEVAAFEILLNDRVLRGHVGQESFTKNGETWYVSYGPINGTAYFLLMVVPESDITKSVDDLEADTDTAMTILIVIVVLVLAFIIVVGTFFAVRTSRKITGPVEVFNRILHDIAEQNDDDSGLNNAFHHEYQDINNLQNKIHNLFLAVKFSTDSYFKGDYQQAIACLEEVEDMFFQINQKRALGVLYNNKGNILRRSEGKKDSYASALKSLNQSVENISEFVQNTELELNAAEDMKQMADSNNEAKKKELVEFLTLFRGTLASRLSNYGDCLREAGKYEQALEVLTRSYDINCSADNLKGMIQALGNKGLVFVDLQNFHEAESCFTSALDMADNQFAIQKDEKTLAIVQQATMNIGLFYYKYAQETLIYPGASTGGIHDVDGGPGIDVQDMPSRRLLEMSLSKIYLTLCISDRIPMHVKQTCVTTLREIYGKYHGEVGALACAKLDEMFPDVQKSGGKTTVSINFLIDVSPSMSGKRIKSCEETLLNIVNNKLTSGDTILVNIFARDYDHLIPASLLSDANRKDVVASLQTLRHRTNKGATYFYSSLSRMAKELASANGTAKEQWIVALTDGEDNERGTTYQNAKAVCTKLNIKIILISVGLEDDRVLKILKFLASEEKYFIKATDDPAAITDALGKGFEMAASSGNVMMESL